MQRIDILVIGRRMATARERLLPTDDRLAVVASAVGFRGRCAFRSAVRSRAQHDARSSSRKLD
jgi:transcriptional regulator GlxA family with amidase domain